jgi:CheY-like chemotaxis protein
MNVLLIDPDADARAIIDDTIRDQLDEFNPDVRVARHFQGAQKVLSSTSFDVIVTNIQLPPDEHEYKGEPNQLGLDLAKQLNEQASAPTVVVMIPPGTPEGWLSEINRLTTTRPVEQHGDYPSEVAATIQTLYSSLDHRGTETARDPTGFVKISIDQQNQECMLSIWTEHSTPSDRRDEPFTYPAQSIELISDLSEILAGLEGDNWFKQFRSIGKTVRNFIQNDPRVFALMETLKTKVGGYENVRFVFEIDASSHSLPFESVLQWADPDVDDPFMMLVSPVYRSIYTAGGGNISDLRPHPFSQIQWGGHLVNCLVIDATVSGVVEDLRRSDGRAVELPKMPSGRQECENLVSSLKALRTNGAHIGEVDLISHRSRRANRGSVSSANDSSDAPIEFIDQLEKVLSERDWDMVHFCGHAMYEEGVGSYVFVPSNKDGRPVIKHIGIKTFAKLLDRTGFVYLSSCQSTERGFVYELASKQVPAIVGYRWEIDDGQAARFATSFYDALFKEPTRPCLESAFQSAQFQLHEQAPRDRHWGTPMLVVQNVSQGYA